MMEPPKEIWTRPEPGFAVLRGPLTENPDYAHYILKAEVERRIAEAVKAERVSIEIRPASDIPAFGAYIAPAGDFESPAKIAINFAAHLAAVAEGDVPKDQLHAFLMETILHEIGHAIEHWLGMEFSEDRVEAISAEYAAHKD